MTDDEKRTRILGEIQALRAEVARMSSREHGRSIARRIRELYRQADYDVAMNHVIPFAMEAKASIVRDLGTDAWEPEPSKAASMAPSIWFAADPAIVPVGTKTLAERVESGEVSVVYGARDQPPLTDEDLANLETIAGPWALRSPEIRAQAALVLRLVAEVRRLRARHADPGQLLSDTELEAIEALIRAALRYTDTPRAKVMSSFDLLMAELRRLRGKA